MKPLRSSSGITSIFHSYHLTLPLAVDVVAADLSAGCLGGLALAVLGLDLCYSVCRPVGTKRRTATTDGLYI